MSEEHDLGHGYSYSMYAEYGVDGPTGILIVGPAGPACPYRDEGIRGEPGMCGGGVPFECSPAAQKSGRARWKVVQLEPLTLSPSIACKCNFQHGHIREGRYDPA